MLSEIAQRVEQKLEAKRAIREALNKAGEPLRVITVRMPKSLHERLKEASHELEISLNCFCVASLEAAADEFDEEQIAGDEPVTIVDLLASPEGDAAKAL